jgi:hypothetical protein
VLVWRCWRWFVRRAVIAANGFTGRRALRRPRRAVATRPQRSRPPCRPRASACSRRTTIHDPSLTLRAPKGQCFRQARHVHRAARQPVVFHGRNNPSSAFIISRRTTAILLIVRADGAYSSRTAARPRVRGQSVVERGGWRDNLVSLGPSRITRPPIHGPRGEDLMLLRRLAAVVALSALLFSSGCCCHRWCNRPCWRPFCRTGCYESPCCTPCCAPCGPPVCSACGP